jgi:prolycopene isomerase
VGGARGVGTELAAASAMECVDRVLADLGRPLLARPAAWSGMDAIGRAASAPVAWMTRA